MNPLHVISQLFQVLDISVTYFTDDKVSFPLAGTGLAGFDGGAGGALLGGYGAVTPGQRRDGNARRSRLVHALKLGFEMRAASKKKLYLKTKL